MTGKPSTETRPAPRRAFRGVTHDERRRQRRERLLEAALEAFGTHGYHAVTVREVCSGAKLTERYFYESFKGIDELFLALYTQINDELRAGTLAALAAHRGSRDVVELAGAAIRVLLEMIVADPRKARVMLIDAVSISHDLQRAAGEVMRGYAQLLREFIDLLFPDARAQGVDPGLIAAGLLGANVHIATQWVREGFGTPLEQVLSNNLIFYRALEAHWGRAGGGVQAAESPPR